MLDNDESFYCERNGWFSRHRLLTVFILAPICTTLLLWAAGYHIVWKPTPEQLFGCKFSTVTPSGECP